MDCHLSGMHVAMHLKQPTRILIHGSRIRPEEADGYCLALHPVRFT